MKSVAILVETSNAYGRGIIDGVVDWQRENDAWSNFLPEQERGAPPPSWLKKWQGDGIIARIETIQTAERVADISLPIVDVSAARHISSLPWVETDDVKIADLAFEHFETKLINNFAFCGEPFFGWARNREQRFVERARSAGKSISVLHQISPLEARYSWTQERMELGNWLSQLKYPVGILAAYDIKGQQILDACRDLGISVPNQVSVLGIDNDTQLCNLCTPQLSSVSLDARKAGYIAASLLNKMMNGETVSNEGFFVPPVGIVERKSTDVYAVDDPIVFDALHFIRDNACDGIQVADVVERSDISRRALEFRFEKFVGRSPHQEIERVKINQVKLLLSKTELTLEKIAYKVGYANPEYLSTAFKRATKITPSQYRRKYSK
ncbi:AraC family transcriptional regulator [Calycomorphotria hydatis]|uniref:Xylose operon regulatory protein n=1 Tax=Calycomorphotria hydatis TaxID=2528027 RepID=A0A517T691_9PLAN|nr:DNA-binding transcriptional regulator [Calycomorphotria hydatis]QDT63868.1 Xylose operon regulatory protein [Calycomorphotria hydatis]